MSDLECPECGRAIAIYELETRTVAQTEGFRTTYQCPFCRAEFEDVAPLL